VRVTRNFTDQPLQAGGDIELGKEAARHLITVLRLQAGDPLVLFNGVGGEYAGVITAVSAKSVRVRIGEHDPDDRESPLRTFLGIGISRGDRFDWVLQKATELGVSEIFPLYTERTEVKLKGDREDKKLRHWRQILISACEQSGRNRIPLLHAPQGLREWFAVEAGCKLLLHHRSNTTLKSLADTKHTAAALLIGPEGGLSSNEIEQGMAAGFQSLTVGPRVFRTETAPLVVLSILQGMWGDF